MVDNISPILWTFQAEEMAEQDKIQREKVEYANNAENHINNIEKNISEYKDQLPADEVGYTFSCRTATFH